MDPANARIEIRVTGPRGPVPLLTGTPERTSSATGSLEITYRHLAYPAAGRHLVAVTVTNGAESFTGSVVHEVVVPADQAGGRRPKNVIFFLGDGMGAAAVTAARLLSKGITEGKYHGLLEMDRMDHRGIVGTSGADSIATDSANSMSAYMTGHKSSVNAMGVYESNAVDVNTGHPRVETMAEMLKRARGMAIGVVTTAEVQDATPAAVWAHTRRRSEYVAIMDQALNPAQRPDVLMGGGLASLLPKSQPDDFEVDPAPTQPALLDATGKAVDNPADDAGAELQTGNLPFSETNCVHTVEDVYVIASGPGSQRFNAFLDNTEIFHNIIDALGLDARK